MPRAHLPSRRDCARTPAQLGGLVRVALAGALGGLAAAGCGAPAQVEVRAYVGDAARQVDEATALRVQLEAAGRIAQAVLADLRAARRTQPDAAQPPTIRPAAGFDSPATEAELIAALASLRAAAIEDVEPPARRIAAAQPGAWPAVKAALLAPRRHSKREYVAVLDTIGGDVPNRYGHFHRQWLRDHGHRVQLSEDWLADLLALPKARIGRLLHPVLRDAIATSALLRAAGTIGRTPEHTADVVDTLLDAAYLLDGTFRDEVGRALRSIGDEAVAQLVRRSAVAEATDPASIPARQAEYARVQLDLLDRQHPTRALAVAAADPRRLVDLLQAYGEQRTGEAAQAILGYVDADGAAIREAARAAFRRYVHGPLPTVRTRTVRLLGGGSTTARAELTYRQRALLAVREALDRSAPGLLEPECQRWTEDGNRDEACEAQAQRLTEAYFQWLDVRRRARRAEAVARAVALPTLDARVAALDSILAAEPDLREVDAFVAVYLEAARGAMAAGDGARAGRLWRKVAKIADARHGVDARALEVAALVAEASVPTVPPHGQRMLLRRARELAPDDPAVTQALAATREAVVDAPGGAPRWLAQPLLGGLAGLLALWLLGAGVRRRWPSWFASLP